MKITISFCWELSSVRRDFSVLCQGIEKQKVQSPMLDEVDQIRLVGTPKSHRETTADLSRDFKRESERAIDWLPTDQQVLWFPYHAAMPHDLNLVFLSIISVATFPCILCFSDPWASDPWYGTTVYSTRAEDQHSHSSQDQHQPLTSLDGVYFSSSFKLVGGRHVNTWALEWLRNSSNSSQWVQSMAAHHQTVGRSLLPQSNERERDALMQIRQLEKRWFDIRFLRRSKARPLRFSRRFHQVTREVDAPFASRHNEHQDVYGELVGEKSTYEQAFTAESEYRAESMSNHRSFLSG